MNHFKFLHHLPNQEHLLWKNETVKKILLHEIGELHLTFSFIESKKTFFEVENVLQLNW